MRSDQTPGFTAAENKEVNELHTRSPADALQTIERIRERLKWVCLDGLTKEQLLGLSTARLRLATAEDRLRP